MPLPILYVAPLHPRSLARATVGRKVWGNLRTGQLYLKRSARTPRYPLGTIVKLTDCAGHATVSLDLWQRGIIPLINAHLGTT